MGQQHRRTGTSADNKGEFTSALALTATLLPVGVAGVSSLAALRYSWMWRICLQMSWHCSLPWSLFDSVGDPPTKSTRLATTLAAAFNMVVLFLVAIYIIPCSWWQKALSLAVSWSAWRSRLFVITGSSTPAFKWKSLELSSKRMTFIVEWMDS